MTFGEITSCRHFAHWFAEISGRSSTQQSFSYKMFEDIVSFKSPRNFLELDLNSRIYQS